MKTPMKMMKLKVIDIEIELAIRSGIYTISFYLHEWTLKLFINHLIVVNC